MLGWVAIVMSAASLLLISLHVLRGSRENTDAEQASWLEKPDP